ncbi:hypothetical protein OAJ60_04880 [Planctomycetaceae bacterium]|nr:hypothetical protein [Planctomycetaceae bacterium]
MHSRKSTFLITAILLVVLRIAIGWQFLYEGLWKFQSRQTARPWTSAGYLRNSQGPLRNVFRGLTDDPDELNWLDSNWVGARWDTWQTRFVAGNRLDKTQESRLNRLLNGPKDFRAELAALPDGLVSFPGTLAKRLTFDAKSKRLIVDGKVHLTPRERDAALKLVPVPETVTDENREAEEVAQRFREALGKVFARSSRLSFKERMRASLLGDPERAGLTITDRKTKQELETRLGEIELYRRQLQRYEQNLARVETDFQQKHVQQSGVPGYGDTAEIRSALVGPIKALEGELIVAAEKLLTPKQRARGPVAMPPTRINQIDALTMWGLAAIGVLLISGLCSRLAAVAGAALLFSFYLAMPPWPGVPPAPGPEHSLWVNKNLIEVFALLVLASVPTGRWFGLDSLVGRLPLKRQPEVAVPQGSTDAVAVEAPEGVTTMAVEPGVEETDTESEPDEVADVVGEPESGNEAESGSELESE